jgi:hypothetical protein
MKTKWILLLVIGLFFSLAPVQKAQACDIQFEIVKGEKATYHTGDTLIVKVKVALTHRACPVALQKTQFKLKGLKVLKSTKWKQKSANEWERKLMIVVTETKGKELSLVAIRECDKDGGYGALKMEVAK